MHGKKHTWETIQNLVMVESMLASFYLYYTIMKVLIAQFSVISGG